jgi:hypothetical protein
MNRKIIYLAAILFITLFAVSCRDETPEVKEVQEPVQELQVDRRYRPLAHHFGSTGCSSCGRIGIPVMEALATEMADSVVPFITHFKYNDPFITSSSEAIEAYLVYQSTCRLGNKILKDKFAAKYLICPKNILKT